MAADSLSHCAVKRRSNESTTSKSCERRVSVVMYFKQRMLSY